MNIIKSGVKYWDNNSPMDGGRKYWVIKSNNKLTDEDILIFLENQNIDVDGYGASYPGQSFSDSVDIYIHNKKALVTKRFGWDI